MTNWNGNIGTHIEAGMSVSDMLKAARLDYTVELSPYSYGKFGEFVSDDQIAYRSDNGRSFGVYKNRVPFQNHDMIAMFQDFAAIAGLEINEIGSFDGGASIWASADLPVEYDWNVRKVGDITKSKLVLSDSHLPNHGMNIHTWNNRLYCTNGNSQKVNQKIAVISHAGGIDTQTAKTVLAGAMRGLKLKGDIYDRLASTSISIEEYHMLLIDTLGNPDKSIEDQPEIVKSALRLFKGDGMGSEALSAFGTVYGGLQAVTEYYSHHARTESAESRFKSVLTGDYHKAALSFEKRLVSVYCNA